MTKRISIFNNDKYIMLHYDNNYKSLSLETNIYFTLKDIYINAIHVDDMCSSIQLNRILVNHLFDDNNINELQNANILNDITYLKKLYCFLNHIHYTHFEMTFANDICDNSGDKQKLYYDIDFDKYIEVSTWFKQLEYLKNQVKKRLESLK